jgi:SAM-dependent methyltransferase
VRAEKRIVKEFYDRFGWRRTEEGSFGDTAGLVRRYSAFGEYGERVRRRAGSLFKPQGGYFLDAGSGAVSSSAYANYSAGYRRHVCIDISETAVKMARERLREQGAYVVGDVVRLPFPDNLFDSIWLAHVLYHVPLDEQEAAVRELFRTLKPGGTCVIVYAWKTCLMSDLGGAVSTVVRHPGQFLPKLSGRLFRRKAPPPAAEEPKSEPSSGGASAADGEAASRERPPLYYAAHDYRWFKNTFPREWNLDIRCWGAADEEFVAALVPNNAVGRFLLRVLFRLESLLPHLMARIGRFPLIVIRKPGNQPCAA